MRRSLARSAAVSQTIPGYMISQADANLLRTGNGRRALLAERHRVARRLAGVDVLARSALRRQHRQAGNRRARRVDLRDVGQLHGHRGLRRHLRCGTDGHGRGGHPEGCASDLSIGEIKQILVNTADTDVYQPSVGGFVFPDQLAPITRIGGGEVRVDRALLSPG